MPHYVIISVHRKTTTDANRNFLVPEEHAVKRAFTLAAITTSVLVYLGRARERRCRNTFYDGKSDEFTAGGPGLLCTAWRLSERIVFSSSLKVELASTSQNRRTAQGEARDITHAED
jgi:hypothetical protein